MDWFDVEFEHHSRWDVVDLHREELVLNAHLNHENLLPRIIVVEMLSVVSVSNDDSPTQLRHRLQMSLIIDVNDNAVFVLMENRHVASLSLWKEEEKKKKKKMVVVVVLLLVSCEVRE